MNIIELENKIEQLEVETFRLRKMVERLEDLIVKQDKEIAELKEDDDGHS